jgi:hypothetical protein
MPLKPKPPRINYPTSLGGVPRNRSFSGRIWAASFIENMCKKLSPFLLLLLLCSGCTQARVERAAPIQPQPPLPSLAMVKQGEVVEIQNDWNGYSDITPILRHYKLWVKNKELVGNAHIAVGGYGAAGIHQQATTKVKIPAAVTAQFLATLAKTPIKSGSYKPLINRTDDYPSVTIQVKVKQQLMIFSSQSQGASRVPWKVRIRSGKTNTDYISNADFPTQALKLLSPYLDNSGIDGIIHRRRKGK